MSWKISWSSACTTSINPLSPNINIQILQTDLHTFPLRISWENLIKDHGIFSMMIILLILITLSLDSVWILLGENNCCWSLLGIKGLKIWVVGQGHGITIGSLSNDDGDGQENSKKAKGLYLPNNNFASASRFLVLFFAVVARLQSETAQFHI